MKRRTVLAGVTAAMAAAPAHAAKDPEAASPLGRRTNAEGCVALVTGSNQGIGLGFVEVLLARGAKRVYATARRPQTLAPVVALDPKRVVPLELDVTNEAHRRAAASAAADVTWLINNAAYPGSEVAEERRFRTASSLDDIKRVMDTNCWAPAELTRLFIPHILKNGGGAIVQILSGGAFFCLPEFSSYSTSKAAAAMMAASFRADLDREPVLVASVYTGGVQTRAAPVGSKGVTPVEHAHQVLDAMARGETDIYPASFGPQTMRERVCADPTAFERRVVDRFYTNPVKIAPY
jgi:NAD(P)-dependent dehydrogenase (short-subunit alcohol dehydrogenase family)